MDRRTITSLGEYNLLGTRQTNTSFNHKEQCYMQSPEPARKKEKTKINWNSKIRADHKYSDVKIGPRSRKQDKKYEIANFTLPACQKVDLSEREIMISTLLMG